VQNRALLLIGREERDLMQRRTVEEDIDDSADRRADGFGPASATRREEGMEDDPLPPFLPGDREPSADRAIDSIGRRMKILPHDRGMKNRRERQGPGIGRDHVAERDRALPHGGDLDVLPRRLLDIESRTARHPEIIICRKEENVSRGPGRSDGCDLDTGLNEME